MEHDNPVRVEYRNLTQGTTYEAEFETVLGAETFISAIDQRTYLEVESTENF